MKRTAPYFGNRFATVVKKNATKARKTKATSEMEALEPRILLSGVGTGLNKKNVTFLDADGDKVSVKIQGRGASFDIDLGGNTNNSDIANIDINGNGSLGVVVTPVGSFTKPVKTTAIYTPNPFLPDGLDNISFGNGVRPIIGEWVQTQYYNLTPGYTNIGGITAAGDIGSIGLNAAVVSDINLGGNANFINLSTGMVAKVDQFMETNGSFLPGYANKAGFGGWTAGLGNIDFFNITAKGSVAGINISGSPTGVNDYMGDISVASLGRLTGTNSAFNGHLTLTGPNAVLGSVLLGNGWGNGASITATENLTFNAAGFSGVLDVGGHLNLTINGGAFTGTILADKGISGLRSSTTDDIFFTSAQVNAQIFATGDISDIFLTNSSIGTAADTTVVPIILGQSGSIRATGNIGDITIGNGGTINNITVEGANLGTITALNTDGLGAGNSFITKGNLEGIILRNGDLDNSNTISVTGNIGLIDLSNGDYKANLSAGSFGNIILRGNGDLSGILKSTTGGIGSVTVHFGDITGTISSAANIGSIEVEGGSIQRVITAGGSIDLISANWLDAKNAGSGIAGTASIHAVGNIAAVSASSTNGDGLAADASIRTEATLGSVTGVSYSNGAGIAAANLIGNAIGDIKAISVNGVGIDGLTVSSATAITSIAGSGLNGGINALAVSAGGNIASITASTVNGVALQGSRVVVGAVGAVVAASDFGTGIIGSSFSATTGGLDSISGSGDTGGLLAVNITTAGTVGSVSGAANGITFSGSGLDQVNIVAGESVGTISGSSTSNNPNDAGINNTFVSAQNEIGTVTGTGTGASGILGSSFVSQLEDIDTVTGSSTDANGSGVGIGNTAIISMAGIVGSITGSASGDGFGLVDITISAQTNVANVTGTSIFGTGIGETFADGSLIYAAIGNIGAVTGSSLNAQGTGDGISGLEVRADKGSIASITGNASDLTVGGGSGLVDLNVFAAKQGANPLDISGTANGGDGISDGNYLLASGDMNVSGNTVTGSAIAGGASFEATQGTVTISITATGQGANGINNANFTGASIAPITISLSSSQAGDAINQGTFTATTGDIGAVTISNNSANLGRGIANSLFDAQAGNIGAVSVTMTGVGAGTAIDSSAFQAVGNITSLTVNSTSTGVSGSSFTADREGNGVGALGPISVTVTGENASGITNVSVFSGASIGNISVTAATSLTNDAINGSTFTATAGDIGTITAIANGADATDSAVETSNFFATGSIGAITATAKAGDALFNVTATADTDLSGAGDLATITATSATGSAIVNGAYTGNSIGNITASSTTGSAVSGASFTATSGNIGNISATGAIFGFNTSTTNAFQSIGDITATVTGTTTGNSAIAGKITAQNGTIGNFLVTSAAKSSDVFTGIVNAGTGIGNISITAATAGAALSAQIDADTLNIWTLETPKPANFGQIGNISVTSTGEGFGIDGASVTAAEIGNISVTLSSTKALDAISNSTFTAGTQTESIINNGVYNNFGKIGNITVVNATQTGSGNGIISSEFQAGNAGKIGNIAVTMVGIDGTTGGDGISRTTFDSTGGALNNDIFSSTIGTINVIHTGTGVAIGGDLDPHGGPYSQYNVGFFSNAGVGAVTVVAQGTGMENVDISSEVDGDGIGSIGNVDVLITGKAGNGVIGGNWTGASIGNIDVDFTRADGTNGITGLTATATKGSIGSITVGATNPPTGTGISGGTFSATVDIGTITVTAIGDAIVGSSFTADNNVSIAGITATSTSGDAIDTSSFTADKDGSGAGDVGNIVATTATGSAITNNSSASGANIGNILATVTGDNPLGANLGISGSTFTATAGNIGTITASTAGTNAGDHAIQFANFSATNNIGAISATALNGDGIHNTSFVANSDGILGGDLSTIVATTTKGSAITDGSQFKGDNVGNVTATVTGAGNLAISNSFFTATAGNIGTITAKTAGTDDVDHAIANQSAFSATNNIGDVSATALNGDGINNSFFTADAGTPDLVGDLGTITATTTNGSAITNSTSASGANIGIIIATVLGADGLDAIQDSTFTATAGNIGAITADTAGTGDAIDNSDFFATNNIGSVIASSTNALGDDGIFLSTFIADTDGDLVGDLGSIKASSVNADGIDVSTFQGANIGSVLATVSGDTGDDAIDDSTFTATAGNIGTIIASTAGTAPGDHAIAASGFIATNNIGAVSATALAGDGINNSTLTAGNDIVSIFATTDGTESNAINFSAGGSITAGNNLGAFTATVTAEDGGSVFFGAGKAVPVVTVGGNAASITINNASTVLTAHGLDNVKMDITGALGPVTITVAGGSAMNNSSIDPSSIGIIGLKTTGVDAGTGIGSTVMLNSEIITTKVNPGDTGDITSVTLTTSNGGLGMDGSTIQSAGNIGSVSSNGGLNNSTLQIGRTSVLTSLNVSVTTGDALNNVTVTYDGQGSPTGTAATASIGTITVVNTGQQITDQGIVNSDFFAGSSGTGIGDIKATVAGGEGIVGSNFTAQTTPYIPTNTEVVDEGTFIAPLGGVYSVNPNDLVNSTAAPFPVGFTGDINFSAPLAHTRVDGNGGFTPWNFGGIWGDVVAGNLYDGDVYVTSTNSVTLNVAPAPGDSPIGSIIFYVLGTNPGQNFTVSVPGMFPGEELTFTVGQFATAVEVTATDSVVTDLSAITITTDPGQTFGVGQFSVALAAAPAPDTADIGTITVINTGVFVSSDGISNSNFTAADSIGDIEVQVGATIGFPFDPTGGTGILESSFKAVGGNIGKIDVTNISEDLANSFGMKSVVVDAKGTVGDITVVSVGTALTDKNIPGSETLITSGGNMGDISLTSSEGSALDFDNSTSVITVGGDLTSFTAKSLATTGDIDAVVGHIPAHVALDVAGNVTGNILITNASTDANADAMADVKFDIAGNVSGTTTITAAGGAAMNNASIDPVDMGDITLTGKTDAMLNSELIATGVVSKLTVNGNIDGTSKISVGSLTGDTTITGNLAGTIESTVGSIGNITVAGNITSSIESKTNIGNIAGTGTGNSTFSLTTGASGAIGNITFDKLANTNTVKVTLDGAILTIGNILVDAPTGTANLFTLRDGVSPINLLQTLGNVTVDGNWTVDNDLPFITQIGNVSVGGGITGGNIVGAAAGMDITSTNNGSVSVGGVTPAAGNSVTFRIDNTYSGTVTIDSTPYNNYAVAPFDGTPVDGFTVVLV